MDVNMTRVGKVVQFAIKEDVWTRDITSESVLDPAQEVTAAITAKQAGIVCGIQVVEKAFNLVDPNTRFKYMVKDGDRVEAGREIAFIEGNVLSVMRTERVALNFLSYLSGVSTRTREFVDKVRGTKAKIYDTRKTMPLHRYMQKYAVRVGGGENHRWGLWDMVLIKDNHLRAYGIRKKTVNNESVIRGIIKEARENVQRNIKIEIEVESLNEAKYALQEAPDIIMLDNMQPEDVRKAVKLRAEMGLEERVKLEVSGGITLSNVREYAETGIDMISSGSLTASIASIDYSMEIVMRDNQ